MDTSSNALRQAFLDYFAARGHEVAASSSLVPIDDPTLLFTNAGMVQFKDVFLGRESRAIPRAASAQRCVRAGGKHNDLENVGYTARHHTFFEMLGNFSFGDYFKRDAIRYAWAFVTEVLKLPPERLWCTVYKDDDEAAAIWLDEIGVDPARFARLGEDENFWAMGDTGPCGPCSEIFYDHGPELPGGPPGSDEADGDRFVEIWNLVFMQFERDADGHMTPLPKPSVDTGMGLERLAAVMQGVHSNYEIDLFVRLIDAAAAATGTSDRESKSLRVIADHIRACAYLIADGVEPGNEGRGYVLRRIIRRAVRHGFKLGVEQPFFHTLVGPLDALMGAAHPELGARRKHVERVLEREEQSFLETLSQGMHLLDEATDGLVESGQIPGDVVFKLHDTYGFPVDLTADIARERGLTIDRAGFDARMGEQRARARRASRFGTSAGAMLEKAAVTLASAAATEFVGYETIEAEGRVTALFDAAGEPVERLEAGAAGLVVLDRTPFYAESGGQIGDTGVLSGAGARFDVGDAQKAGTAVAHVGTLAEGTLAVGAALTARVDGERRDRIVLNHTATHLLHAALRRVLGEHVQQKGSLVAPDRLRFDFSHYEPLTAEQIAEIEEVVNDRIRANVPADTAVMPYEDAMQAGALAFFGEKYGDRVRVLKIGDFSTELCGGTHASRAGDIGVFKIVSEAGIAAGVRRIEAVTGRGALEWITANDRMLKQVAGLVRGTRDDVADKVGQLVARSRQLEREVQALKAKLATGSGRDPAADARDVNGIKLLVTRMDGVDDKSLRDAADRLKSQLGSGIVVIGAATDGKVRLVAAVSKDLTDQIHAGNLIKPIAAHVGGTGGGRPDFGQGGGNRPEALDEALARVAAELPSASTA